jgi:hypothetical protein
MRHSGGEYACTVTAGSSPAWLTRWMSAPMRKRLTGPQRPARRLAPEASRSSRTLPAATASAPPEVVVVEAGVMVVHQQISHTPTLSSR